MEEKKLYITYFNLTDKPKNPYFYSTFNILTDILRNYFSTWEGFFAKRGEFSLGFYIVTKAGTEILTIKGPTIARKMQVVDYSIFLPDEIKDLEHYIDLVFEGITIILTKYKVSIEELQLIKEKCKIQLIENGLL